jgi:hypothetical protein
MRRRNPPSVPQTWRAVSVDVATVAACPAVSLTGAGGRLIIAGDRVPGEGFAAGAERLAARLQAGHVRAWPATSEFPTQVAGAEPSTQDRRQLVCRDR